MSEVMKAIAKVQAAGIPIPRNATNPHFRSKYADLGTIMEALGPALATHGLAVTHHVTREDGWINVTTRVTHVESGEFVESGCPMPLDKSSPQGAGSAITYGRRYGISALLALVTEDDDDGNAASKPKPKPLARRPAEEVTSRYVNEFEDEEPPDDDPIPTREDGDTLAVVQYKKMRLTVHRDRSDSEHIPLGALAHLVVAARNWARTKADPSAYEKALLRAAKMHDVAHCSLIPKRNNQLDQIIESLEGGS